MCFYTFGDADVLRMDEVDIPEPWSGEVRVRVRAAGVNPLDSHIRRSWMEQLFPTPLPSTPGTELAGVVHALRSNVLCSRVSSIVTFADLP